MLYKSIYQDDSSTNPTLVIEHNTNNTTPSTFSPERNSLKYYRDGEYLVAEYLIDNDTAIAKKTDTNNKNYLFKLPKHLGVQLKADPNKVEYAQWPSNLTDSYNIRGNVIGKGYTNYNDGSNEANLTCYMRYDEYVSCIAFDTNDLARVCGNQWFGFDDGQIYYSFRIRVPIQGWEHGKTLQQLLLEEPVTP